jgi:hypothetical protein
LAFDVLLRLAPGRTWKSDDAFIGLVFDDGRLAEKYVMPVCRVDTFWDRVRERLGL